METPRRLPATLDSARLHMRPAHVGDAAWIFRDYGQDTQVSRYLVWRPHEDIEDTLVFLRQCMRHWGESLPPSQPYVIERREDGRGLGMIHLMYRGSFKAEVGYVLARAHWGQGVMSEALTALLEATMALGTIHRVYAVADVENVASTRVMEKAGMAREGVLRRFMIHPNVGPHPRDVVMYARVLESQT